MNVLSLFDGISGGQEALRRLNIKVDNYFASEIDKYAIQVTNKNFPNTIQLGDVRNIKGSELPKIDLLIGGSPCQGFSFAGKQLNFDDPRSKLFFEYVRLLREVKPRYFLLENVVMKKEYQDVISQALGIEPIMINSSLVSAQSRKRLYWTNIKEGYKDFFTKVSLIPQPMDQGILLKDIIINASTDRDKSHCIDANYAKSGNLKSYFKKSRRQLVFSPDSDLKIIGEADLNGYDCIKRVYSTEGKAPTLTTCTSGNSEPKISLDNITWRKLTPLECERLQTFPDGYTEGISNSQRYKALGNSFTVEVIKHILSFMEV